MPYADNRGWSDKYIPAVKLLVGPHLLEPSPFEVDVNQATDLITLRARNITIACRIRRAGFKQYSGEFTVRCKSKTGVPTEIHKLLDHGYANWMFYAIVNSDTEPAHGFYCWYLLDLNIFRRSHYQGLPEVRRNGPIPNGDGTQFYAYRITDFPREIVIDGRDPVLEEAVEPKAFIGDPWEVEPF